LDAACQQGLIDGKNPDIIIEESFDLHKPHFTDEDKNNFLFKVIQYVERQVVLVDALEDAAYSKIHQVNTLQTVLKNVESGNLSEQFSIENKEV
tara:strand:+ start:726 stop:1007 length:282 start_codon:yes stop_codon:yes gene_type:complete